MNLADDVRYFLVGRALAFLFGLFFTPFISRLCLVYIEDGDCRLLGSVMAVWGFVKLGVIYILSFSFNGVKVHSCVLRFAGSLL